MTHVFIVDSTTFKYHLEYMFAGTGAKDKKSEFLSNSTASVNSTTERNLVGMIADISRIRIDDNVIFYLQASGGNQGQFFGVFKVASLPFFDENDGDNYLKLQTGKGLSYRICIKPYEVYPNGVTEHEYLDSLKGKSKASDLCWSLIYRKLKGNRGCTMIMDYEYEDLLEKLRIKNNRVTMTSNSLTFDSSLNKIVKSSENQIYNGRKESLNILPRLLFKANNNKAFETHLQAFITQNFDKGQLAKLLINQSIKNYWIGNEVSCGVGMQRIDIMIKQETKNDVIIRLVELKDEAPYESIVTSQIVWYLEWLSDYVIPNYKLKNIRVIPTVIAKGNIPADITNLYKNFSFNISGATVSPLEYIGFNTTAQNILFEKYI